MKQQVLKLIDRKIEQYPYEDDDTGMDLHSEHNKFRRTLQELRSEIEKMEEWIPVTERLPENDNIIL